jgi:hypothetical protein
MIGSTQRSLNLLGHGRAELDWVIGKVYGMGLVAQERDRVLTPMREEQNQMPRIIAAANKLR